jgi:hypothetical protein
MTQIFILHRDVAYEQGDVYAVEPTLEKAKAQMNKFCDDEGRVDPDEWKIEWWTVGEDGGDYHESYHAQAAEGEPLVWRRMAVNPETNRTEFVGEPV